MSRCQLCGQRLGQESALIEPFAYYDEDGQLRKYPTHMGCGRRYWYHNAPYRPVRHRLRHFDPNMEPVT